MNIRRHVLVLIAGLATLAAASAADDELSPIVRGGAIQNPASSTEGPSTPPIVEDARVIQRRSGAALAGSPRSTVVATQSSWMRTLLSLGGVTALILLLSWGYRAVTAGNALTARPKAPGMIQVLSRTILSPRQSLVLVRVGPRMVLIGASQDALTTLHTIDDPDVIARIAGVGAEIRPDAATAEFRDALESAAHEFAPAEPAAIAASAPSPVAAANRRLADSIKPRRAASAGV